MEATAAKAVDLLLIGYGNPLRRDDGAGLALAHYLAGELRARGQALRHMEVQQLVPELAAEIANPPASHVLFFDATVMPEAHAIQLRELRAARGEMTMGHQCSADLLLYMARELYGSTARAWLITIPGVDFAHGAGFSPQVAQLLDEVKRGALLRRVNGEILGHALWT